MKKIVIAVMMFAFSVPAMADTGGGVLGALLGAAIGNQVGGGNGKKVATVVGALAGANIGSRMEDGTYGRDADGNYVCVENCGGTRYGTYDREAEAAAARGAANRLQREHDREREYTLRQAYCSQDYEGCRYGRGYQYNYGHPIVMR